MKIFYNYLITSLFPAHFATSDIQVCNPCGAYMCMLINGVCFMVVYAYIGDVCLYNSVLLYMLCSSYSKVEQLIFSLPHMPLPFRAHRVDGESYLKLQMYFDHF